MKRKILIYSICTLIVSLFTVSASLAQCPEGKSPVLVTPPSGIVKTLCIPDSGISGIENAAEHSGGTIVAAECPCWTPQEVNDVAAAYPELICYDTINSLRCDADAGNHGSDYIFAVKIEGSYYSYSLCVNTVTQQIVEYISSDEVNACRTLVEPYIYTP